MKRKAYYVSVFSLASILLAAGCGTSGKEGADAPNTATPDVPDTLAPIALTMFKEDTGVSADTIEQLIRSKFPQVELNLIRHGKGTTIEEVIASGVVPDIVSYTLGGLWKLKDLKLLSDLTPLMQQRKFDTGRFVDGVVDTVKSYSDDGQQFLVMPFELNNNALFYNKDIFDRLGVTYPQDGMTWEQLYELTRRVVRTDAGTQVHGFHYNFLNVIYKNQLALPFVDPATNKAAVNRDEWAKWIRTMTSFYTIPGNQPPVDEKTAFLKNQTLAMRTGPNYMTELAESSMNWDVVSLPHFEGMAGAGSQMNAPYYAIPPASVKKEAAFRVIEYLLSDEVAIELTRQGRIPILKNDAVRQAYGKGIAGLENKNLTAFYKDTIARPAVQTEFDGAAKSAFNRVLVTMLDGQKDVNTGLREIEEQINKAIEEQMRK